MNFPLDDSTQTNTALLTTGTSSTYVDSNDLSTKQNVLDASTNLLGIGTSIRDLNYNNITINKPTNFQSDWNSIIINKPTNFQSDWNSTIINKPSSFAPTMTNIYSKTETDNLLNTKENALTFSSPLTRTTNTIGINLANYSTTGNDTNYLLKTGGTMTGDLTVNNISLPSNGVIKCNDLYHYIELGSYPLDTTTIQEYGTISFNIGPTKTQKAYINSSGLTATAFSGNGPALTNLTYANITGKPTNFQADWKIGRAHV